MILSGFYSFALQMKASNDDKNFLKFYSMLIIIMCAKYYTPDNFTRNEDMSKILTFLTIQVFQ